MSFRLLALIAFFAFTAAARAQEAFANTVTHARDSNGNRLPTQSAWLDLRQTSNATPQNAPRWVESVTLVPVAAREGRPASSIFRIRIQRRDASQMLMLRLFFEDKPGQRPRITAWDESGTQVLRSNELGSGVDLPSSDTVLLPMIGVSCIDVEVAGDGSSVRGLLMDWMTSQSVAHPSSAERREIIPEPFAAAAPLRVLDQDAENFGAVTASLSPDTIRIGASVATGASFQFGLEAQPLVALLSFEVANARADAPPEIFLNGESLGAVSLILPDLADPGYRGETARMVDQMRFNYTGWVRAQKLIPASRMRPGTNDLIVIGGPGTPASAIRATQIQLKYLWDKADYLLQTAP